MKKTLLVSFAAAALLSVACGSSKAEEKKDAPATEPAPAAAPTDGAAAPAAEGGEAKPEG